MTLFATPLVPVAYVLLFGTYANPEHFAGRVGFDVDESQKLKDMLLMRKVSGS